MRVRVPVSQDDSRPTMSRRGVLRMGAAAAVAGTATAAMGAAPAEASGGFAHPGMLHNQADFERMAAAVKAGRAPYKAGYAVLAANSHAQSTWKANPLAKVVRGGDGTNVGTLYHDVHAAYQNALRWKVTGDSAHADAARDILNAWSAVLTSVDGNADRFIAAGLHGYQFANAAEIMRGYPGFELARFQKMLVDVFYKESSDFLAHHNGAFITNYWGSWDLLSIACVLATGILCDDQDKVDEAVTYFKTGKGNGSIKNLITHIHPGGLGQWVEVGRDQGHATLGVGLAGAIAEMAWNQGIDLYGYDDNRLLKGFEYVAKWNLGQDVPYTSWTWKYGAPGIWGGSQTLTAPSTASRGDLRPIWESIYNHYVNRRGLDAPYVTAFAEKVRPEGGGGNYGEGGGYDQLGFGTLAFTRPKVIVSAAAPAPAQSTATGAGGRTTATREATPAGAEDTRAQGGSGQDLAASGAGGVAAVAATGVLAIAGGLIALRRRNARDNG
ncbi:alginate lyase family protein [Streptomyces sp. NPDC005538]|uniref:alginate lyase family protein n=1 Tax=unclassified Streptomyces TaxID=2593676 RepID=UPI0033BE8B76